MLDYAREHAFAPLGMRTTMFQPSDLIARIASTERIAVLPGRRCAAWCTIRRYNMGGIAGHAGLFSTADDLLLRFAQHDAEWRRTRRRARLQSADDQEVYRTAEPTRSADYGGLGWGHRFATLGQSLASLFPIASFGHTGFTHTPIWIDPSTQTYVIPLANSVHPLPRPAITSIRGQVATIVAAFGGNRRARRNTDRLQRNVWRGGECITRRSVCRQDADGARRFGGRSLRGTARQAGRTDHQPDGHWTRRAPQH